MEITQIKPSSTFTVSASLHGVELYSPSSISIKYVRKTGINYKCIMKLLDR